MTKCETIGVKINPERIKRKPSKNPRQVASRVHTRNLLLGPICNIPKIREAITILVSC